MSSFRNVDFYHYLYAEWKWNQKLFEKQQHLLPLLYCGYGRWSYDSFTLSVIYTICLLGIEPAVVFINRLFPK